MERLEAELTAWGLAAGIVLGAALVGLLLHPLLFGFLRRVSARTPWALDDRLFAHARRPCGLLLPLLAVQIVLPEVRRRWLGETETPGRLLSLLLIAGLAWLLIALLNAVDEHLEQTQRIDVENNLEARRRRTQTMVLKRVLVTFVVVAAVGTGLMTFPRVRQIGTTLLASAGIVGLALGIAARPVLENLIAGIQLALTQPVRLDDVVIVEGEWGRVEEITATYVVVRIWDQRRLVVPFSRFISQPFENWTRQTADILGTVFVHTDYTVPVQSVREELQRLVEGCEEWDGRVCTLQVTGATERTMELRALVSASDSSRAWTLRCRVREELIGYLQREHPDALPRARVELEGREDPEDPESSAAG